MLTVGGVKLLVECSYPATDEYYTFQAIDVSDEYQKSRQTLVATLSDGVSYLKCFVSPPAHHGFDEKGFSKNCILQVSRFVCFDAVADIQVILLDVSVQSSEWLLIGKPSAWQNRKKLRVEDEPVGAVNVKRISFMHNNNNNENDANKEGSIALRDLGKDANLHCDECRQNPCDWMKYGPCILIQINNEYAGKFVDRDGNIVDDADGRVRIGNKQLRFLAYSAFTSMKHGYLGKHNRIPIPKCVESGIRLNYPDNNNEYVGFRSAEQD
jgi:hypothetical protein